MLILTSRIFTVFGIVILALSGTVIRSDFTRVTPSADISVYPSLNLGSNSFILYDL